MKMDYPNPFDGFEVVSTYTDGQACEDGILVAVAAKDRVSRPVWEYLCSRVPLDNVAPEAIDAKRHDHALFTSGRMITTNALEARRVYEQNIGGGIFSLIEQGRKFWIMPNELGGLTLMFPEDY
jgi:hypothetical protein